ncbi:hypothetical protein QMK17_18275 [Rhodococcus sp. G-MC3]|uniref:hypothetical protein n=1 Tax=Rhodococcus sp. G-MC3 TaxID=3046209 RepID=UPI0024B95A87|nr:hypothetical protein [Rhodococcus sp. G-MC3]MDJ0395277.1 hypothetical protein [Rhodococcus sp. G-MC3]
MGGVCGVAVESEAVRISYFRDGQRVEDSIDAEGARWLLNGKLLDCGPFDDVVLTGRDSDVVESLLASLSAGDNSTIRMVDEGAALLAYARSINQLAGARALLVLDLGRHGTSAFTLDVAAGEVLRSARRSALSGEALDDIVERIVIGKGILPPAQGPEAEAEYRAFFRELKELVTSSAGVRAPGDGPMLLTRGEFEVAITATVLQTLAWAAPTDPDAVLLIGGGAHIPLVKKLTEQEWTVPLIVPESPGSVILEGAALEATPLVHQVEIDEARESEVLALAAIDDLESPTTPIRVVAEESAGPSYPHAASVPVVSQAPALPAVSSSPSPDVASSPSRRRIRWSLRDAAGFAGVAAVVLLVWAVIFVRGDTPPPPGIGVDPAGAVTGTPSIAEGVPALTGPAVPAPAAPASVNPGALDPGALNPDTEPPAGSDGEEPPMQGPGLNRTQGDPASAAGTSTEGALVDTEDSGSAPQADTLGGLDDGTGIGVGN